MIYWDIAYTIAAGIVISAAIRWFSSIIFITLIKLVFPGWYKELQRIARRD